MRRLQSVFIKEVFSHGTMCLRRGETGQTAVVVSELLDGVVAVDEEVLLEEVTELQKRTELQHTAIKVAT